MNQIGNHLSVRVYLQPRTCVSGSPYAPLPCKAALLRIPGIEDVVLGVAQRNVPHDEGRDVGPRFALARAQSQACAKQAPPDE
eukprot:2087533-Alexandrium_andersonii.AAC.1